MSWLRKVALIASRSEGPAVEAEINVTHGHMNYTETSSRRMFREAAISRSMTVCPFFYGDDAAFAVVAEATRDVEWVTGLHIRRFGTRLTKEETRALGLRANTIVTQQFAALLTDDGRRDPWLSADTLARMINTGMFSAHYLIEPKLRLALRLNDNAAGPCQQARSLPPGAQAGDCDMLPLRDCSHPDQCFCSYNFWTDPLAEPDLPPDQQAYADELVEQLLGRIVITVAGPSIGNRSGPEIADVMKRVGLPTINQKLRPDKQN